MEHAHLMMELLQYNNLRNRTVILQLAREICAISTKPVRLMEVCGGHTMAIHRFGLTYLLPDTVQLVSGPGCPVCVSSQRFLDACIELSRLPDVIITTYGDLIRVPASQSSLEKERSKGGDIRIVYSVSEALELAVQHPDKQVVFLGIGFETTSPASAYAVYEADRQGLYNFFLFSAHKLMPPALRALADEELQIDGFIAPGHVSSITGTGIYEFLVKDYKKGVVVTGFEPLDLMQSVLRLVIQAEAGKPTLENQYKRVVKSAGNSKAQALLDRVFKPADDYWRGLGVIPLSGLQLQHAYQHHDACIHFNIPERESTEPKGCICGDILKGVKEPYDCPLFVQSCTPDNPVGACMVSGEGSCAIAYKYSRN